MNIKEKAKQFLDIATTLQKKGFFDIFVDYSQAELRIIDLLYREKSEISPSMLSDELRISRVNITNALNSLDNQGLITRSIDPNDRRKVIVSLSDLGVVEAEENIKKVIDFIDQMFLMIGEELTDSLLETVKVVDKKLSS